MSTKESELRVTLVQMPRWEIRTPPFAVALLTSILRKHEFSVFPKDYDIEFYRRVDPADRWAWLGENPVDWASQTLFGEFMKRYGHLFDDVVDDILADSPDVVGFSVKVWSLEFSREAARRLKQRRPDLYVIFGGPEMNKGPEHHLDGHPEVDAICRQEADTSFPSFLRKFVANGRRPAPEPGFAYRGEDGETVDCGSIPSPPQVRDFPLADFSDFDFEKYTDPNLVNLVLSRGCVFRCTFCSEAPAFLRFRSYAADRILAEVEHVAATTNIRKPMRVQFNDSLLNGDLKALEGLADRILEMDEVPFRWGGMMAMRRQMTDELVEKIAKAGCDWTFFGMESGSPKVIKLMRKGHDLETAKRLTRAFHENRITTTVSIVCGYPGEGEKEFYETVDALRQIAPHVDHVMLHTLSLSTGSILTEDPGRFNVDVSTVHGPDSWEWVGDEGRNTLDIRMHRLFTLQHMLRGKVVDYGGPLDRGGAYDPFAQLEAENERRRKSFEALVRYVRVDEVDDSFRHDVGEIDRCTWSDDGRTLQMSGWAKEAESNQPATDVIVIDGDHKVIGHGFVDRRRDDIARVVGNGSTAAFGWDIVLNAQRVEEAAGELRVCVHDAERNRAIRLRGAGRLTDAVASTRTTQTTSVA